MQAGAWQMSDASRGPASQAAHLLPRCAHLPPQVQAAGVEPGEDRALRQQLRQLDGRRAAAESCRLVSVGLGGGGDGGGIAQALRDVQLQVKQLLSQEERLAAAAAAEAAEEKGAAGRVAGLGSEDDDSGVASAAEADGDDGGDGASAAGMLQAAVSLLDEAQGLLDEAEERVVGYARLYRFSQAEYDGLSARLQQVGGWCTCSAGGGEPSVGGG